MNRPFEKWHGLGNDFVVTFDAERIAWWRQRAARLCDRHRGVGADGVLVVGTNPPSMTVINADGSEPEMCGNGLRIVAAALAQRLGHKTDRFDVETGAGVLNCRVRHDDGGTWEVEVAAGVPSFDPADAGVHGETDDGWLSAGELRGIVASIGNPHWIFFEHPGGAEVGALGSGLENDPRFANRTNVEFVTPLGDNAWRVDVWERGVGITQACGTGATAVAASLVHTGRAPVDTPLRIELPGGPLTITVAASGACVVRGPAQRVFRGETL